MKQKEMYFGFFKQSKPNSAEDRCQKMYNGTRSLSKYQLILKILTVKQVTFFLLSLVFLGR